MKAIDVIKNFGLFFWNVFLYRADITRRNKAIQRAALKLETEEN